MRRIGFGAVARTQQLIDRTLAEVAGGQGSPAGGSVGRTAPRLASHFNSPSKGGMSAPLLLQAPFSPLSWRWRMAWPATPPGVRTRSCSLVCCAQYMQTQRLIHQLFPAPCLQAPTTPFPLTAQVGRLRYAARRLACPLPALHRPPWRA